MSETDMCRECRNAEWECCEYYGGGRQWVLTGCCKDLEPIYNEEEEAYECEGYRNEFSPED